MKKLLFLLFVFLLLSSCDRLFDSDDSKSGYLDYLPKKTQVGANTFGCYINGELAASKGWYQEEGVEPPNWGVYIRYVNGFWGIYPDLFNKEKIDTTMQLNFEVKQATLTMQYDSLQRGKYECLIYLVFRGKSGLSGSTVATINITKLDRMNKILSGELDDLDIPLYKTDSIVHLRKVRFDIKYGTDF